MKNIFSIALLLAPVLIFGQNNGFSISGKVSGFADGTKVSFFNRQSNRLDSLTVINQDSFFVKGKHLDQPDFRFLVFDEKDPAIPLLMDNSDIHVSGSKGNLENLQISGSALQNDYQKLSSALAPFEAAFQSQSFTKENVDQISRICESFIEKNSSSFVSLLAVSQLFQISKDFKRTEAALKKVSENVRNTELGKQLAFQIDIQKSSGVGSKILPFSQRDLNGKLISITDFKGKYVLIDFWASWCQPCRMENPNVVANYNRFRNKNFTILGVSLDQSKASWATAVKMDKLEWTQVSDLKGWQNEVSSLFHITSIPQNILIDPDGIIVAKNLRGEALGNTLEKLLGK